MSSTTPERSPYSQRGQLLDDAGSSLASTRERRIDVGHANLDQVRPAGAFRDDAIRADIRNHDGPVGPDAHLGAVGVADPHPLFEAERILEPVHCGPHVRIHEHRRDSRWGRRAVVQHGPTLTD